MTEFLNCNTRQSKWTEHKWHKACSRRAWWLVQTKRPPALVSDQSFKEFCFEISSGNFDSCCLQTITKHSRETSAIGLHEVRRQVALFESVCVTHCAAEAVPRLEGTKFVTISLVLPAIYKLLGNLEKDSLRQHRDDTTVPVASIGRNMKGAQRKYLIDLIYRWVKELSTYTKRLLVIATLLHPCYNHYVCRSEAERRWAETALRNEWQHWKGTQNESTNVLNQGNQPKRPCDFPDDSDDDVKQASAKMDKLDLYLSLAQESKDICVLAWWRNFRLSAPGLAEMARHLLVKPATSAGVDRLFTAAGLTYGDLSAAMTEDTMAQRLLSTSNYSAALYIEGI